MNERRSFIFTLLSLNLDPFLSPSRLLPRLQIQIYVYYELTNFFQNHKRYVRSRDDNQMGGGGAPPPDGTIDDVGGGLGVKGPAERCEPRRYAPGSNTSLPAGSRPVISPCGLVAWSNFNDSFSASLVVPGAAKADKTFNNQRLVDCLADRLLAALRRHHPHKLQRRPGHSRRRRRSTQRGRRLARPPERGPAPDGLAQAGGGADLPQAVGRHRQRRADGPRGVDRAVRGGEQVQHLRLRGEEEHRALHRLLGRREESLLAERFLECRGGVLAGGGGLCRGEFRGVRSVRGQEEEVWGQL